MLIDLFIFLSISFVIIVGLICYYSIFLFPDRKPKLSQFKIYTDGKIFILKYRGRLIGDSKQYSNFSYIKDFRNEYYKRELNAWNEHHQKWITLSSERSIKKYLKNHPEFIEHL
jgi:hypothetical protein